MSCILIIHKFPGTGDSAGGIESGDAGGIESGDAGGIESDRTGVKSLSGPAPATTRGDITGAPTPGGAVAIALTGKVIPLDIVRFTASGRTCMSATPEQVRTAIRTYLKAWGSNDKELLLSIFSEDAVWEDPVGADPHLGHEGIAKFWDFAHQEGTTLTPVERQVIACGNQGILRFTMQLRTDDNKKGLNLHAVDRFVLGEDGKIKHAQAFWDEHCIEQPEGLELLLPNIEEMSS